MECLPAISPVTTAEAMELWGQLSPISWMWSRCGNMKLLLSLHYLSDYVWCLHVLVVTSSLHLFLQVGSTTEGHISPRCLTREHFGSNNESREHHSSCWAIMHSCREVECQEISTLYWNVKWKAHLPIVIIWMPCKMKDSYFKIFLNSIYLLIFQF